MCIVSMNGNVYHRKDCCYANRIKTRYLLVFNIEEAESHGYRECKLCGSFSYYYKLQEHNILHYCLNHDMQFAFRNNALYIQTDSGNWRIIKSGYDGLLRLLHKNGEPDDRELGIISQENITGR